MYIYPFELFQWACFEITFGIEPKVKHKLSPLTFVFIEIEH